MSLRCKEPMTGVRRKLGREEETPANTEIIKLLDISRQPNLSTKLLQRELWSDPARNE